MSKFNQPLRQQGHRLQGSNNRDLQQKLTYQQLLNLNHDLSKENQQLKTIGTRLGEELKNLHVQFQIKSKQQSNIELIHAIGTHPILHNYQLTLVPLLDAYQFKIIEFQQKFETINEEFALLQKKFQDVTNQNENLKIQLTDKIKQIIELYKNGSSEKIGSDFGQLILQQVNQKQKVLLEQNTKLERESQKNKSDADRNKRELIQLKQTYEETNKRLKEYEINFRQLEAELKSIKTSSFDYQVKNNELQTQKNKLQQALERAQSQINQVSKEKQFYLKKHDQYRNKLQANYNTGNQADQNKLVEDLKNKISMLQAEQVPSDHFKKYAKLQKDFDVIQRQNIKLKEAIETNGLKQEELQELISELKQKIAKAENDKLQIEVSQSKLKKSVEQLNAKLKNQIERLKQMNQQQKERLEEELNHKIDQKQKKILQVQEILQKIKLQKDKLEKQNIINSGKDNSKNNRPKESQKAVEKLKEKMTINQELFRQQIQIIQNQNSYLKKQTQASRQDLREKIQEAKKLKQDLQQVKRELIQVTEKKSILIQEIRRVRNQYQGTLKDKERIFDEKIKQIKAIVQQSDKKRKIEREKAQQVARQYKRVLEQIKSTYEERIRNLESQSFRNESQLKKPSNLIF